MIDLLFHLTLAIGMVGYGLWNRKQILLGEDFEQGDLEAVPPGRTKNALTKANYFVKVIMPFAAAGLAAVLGFYRFFEG